MFATGLLIGMSFGVLLTIVGTVWLGSLADEGRPGEDVENAVPQAD
jgi:hypothetical protein